MSKKQHPGLPEQNPGNRKTTTPQNCLIVCLYYAGENRLIKAALLFAISILCRKRKSVLQKEAVSQEISSLMSRPEWFGQL